MAIERDLGFQNVLHWACGRRGGVTHLDWGERHRLGGLLDYGCRRPWDGQWRRNLGGYEAATQMEKDLAEDLRRAGYTVRGGH